MAYAVGVRGRPNMPREFMSKQEMEMARQIRPDLLGLDAEYFTETGKSAAKTALTTGAIVAGLVGAVLIGGLVGFVAGAGLGAGYARSEEPA